MSQPWFRLSLLGTLLVTLVASATVGEHTTAQAVGTLPSVTVTGVAVNNSTAKIDFLPVPGAKDYRVLDINSPTTVKYGGMVHLNAGVPFHFVMQPDGVTPVFPYTSTMDRGTDTQPQTLNEPSTEIEWNLLDDGQPHTLVVQAVDQLGPVPPNNLYDNANSPLNPPAGTLGINEGQTPDGNMSINGQGPYTDTPQVIAQSAPFVVQANPAIQALPSTPNAVQTFFDTFDDSENASLQQSGPIDARTGAMTYTLNAGTPKAWDIIYQGSDTDHSMPMISGGHFMDVLFDGVTPSSVPSSLSYMYHTMYANMSMSPQVNADLSDGKLLHLTEEVDGHLDAHRWLAWQLAPATDPITNFRADDFMTGGFQPTANGSAINNSDQALWIQLFPQECDAMLFTGPRSPTNTAPMTDTVIPIGLPNGGTPVCYRMQHWGGNGVGLDNRQRWDVFLTTNHLALFEDGQLIVQADIPGGLPFTQAKLYFTHYVYATGASFEHASLLRTAPWETYWLNYMTHSDERHWDNMGFEVLPASYVPAGDNFSSLASLIHLPVSVPLAPPTVSGIGPNTGPVGGGESVTITGTNFTSATAVRFGAANANSFTVASPSQIVAVAPPGAVGSVDVSVSTPSGTSATTPGDQFTYFIPSPSITRLSPYTGTTSGGTTVTISGANLGGATAVSFGGVPAQSFAVISPTELIAVTAPGAPVVSGTTVTVVTPGGTSAPAPGARFWFVPQQPSISSLSQASGPVGGGTTLTIEGNNLYAATAIWFGGTSTTNFVVNSPTQITVVTPSHFAKTIDVRVVTPGGVSPQTPSDQYTFM